jgi:hypothetical protein
MKDLRVTLQGKLCPETSQMEIPCPHQPAASFHVIGCVEEMVSHGGSFEGLIGQIPVEEVGNIPVKARFLCGRQIFQKGFPLLRIGKRKNSWFFSRQPSFLDTALQDAKDL